MPPILLAIEPNYMGDRRALRDRRRLQLTLATAYLRAGELDKAYARLERSLADRIAALGEQDDKVLDARAVMGECLSRMGRYAEAHEQFDRVLAGEKEPLSQRAILLHSGMARILLAEGNVEAALKFSEKAVEGFRQVRGEYDVRTGPRIWLVHAQALKRSGHGEQARKYAQQALDASRQYDAPEAESIRQAQAFLSGL